MKYLYMILHTFTGCKEEDLEDGYKDIVVVCKKCGKEHFVFKQY